MNEVGLVNVARRQLNLFLAAVMFLTRLPVGRFHQFRDEDVAPSTSYFPVVGAVIGLAGGLALLSAAVVPSFMGVLTSMLVTICLTGGLHEDGLADCADGLIGGQDPQRRLEIMKDSRIGAYGAIALWLSLTAKLVLVQSLLAVNVALAIRTTVIAHCLGRAATVALLASLPYVRIENPKSSRFGNKVTPRQLAAALVLAIILSFLLLRLQGGLCLTAAIAVTFVCSLYFKSKIGGITGDCLGAANQLVELSAYLSLITLQPAKA
ncbi:MAG TPA: adenosylcobinamide-GDP ribazoletransferase [Chthoniobacterales bacterium]|nr:adenosylcobinamide-GDP ribazoletransferase [Chthoniobacterales bacterium]